MREIGFGEYNKVVVTCQCRFGGFDSAQPPFDSRCLSVAEGSIRNPLPERSRRQHSNFRKININSMIGKKNLIIGHFFRIGSA